MNKRIFIKSVFCSIYSLIIPSNIKNKTIQEKDRIELFYLDINDNKIKRCGMIQSVTDIREQRLDLNFPENIDISGKFSRIRLDSTAPFFNDVVRAGSQRYAFIAKHYQNNYQTTISLIWFKNINMIYKSESTHILEDVSWEAHSIKSTKSNS